MSRRPTPGSDRSAQHVQTLKSLLKLEGNKMCADCKVNKHPRWTSWSLGIFLCIRCSGIHRGLGTDVSRVKSVDLDSWNDDSVQNMLKWGNARANKYWEAKLAPGHVPSEAKIENFIRTKYLSKRWVMDGPMPDPATLDADGDDDVPLTLVQEKARVERSTSQRTQSSSQTPQIRQSRPAAANVDLFGDDLTPPVRPNTADLPRTKPSPAASISAPRATKPGESLFGIDFFGGSQSANPGRPSSAASNPTTSGATKRSDLKSSILSLYASAPKPQPQSLPQEAVSRSSSFETQTPPQPSGKDSFGGLSDAFSGLDFSSTSASLPRQSSTSSAFASLSGLTSPPPPKSTPAAPKVTSPPALSGGNFFDLVSPQSPPPKVASLPKPASNGLDFAFTQIPASTPKPTSPRSQDLFASDDFTSFSNPSPPPVPPPTKVSSPEPNSTPSFDSPFHLSSAPAQQKASSPGPVSRPAVTSQPSTSVMDPWGSGLDNNVWGAPEPAPSRPAQPAPSPVSLGAVPSRLTPNDISGGWGAPISSAKQSHQTPTVLQDEDFGGWTSASPTQTPTAAPPKTGGAFTGPSDPFDNPWG